MMENMVCNIHHSPMILVFEKCHDKGTIANMINSDLLTIKDWPDKWLVSFCHQNRDVMLITQINNRDTPFYIYFGDSAIHEVNTHKNFTITLSIYDDVIKWKHFRSYWHFVRGIHWSPVDCPHNDQSRGALMFSLICAWHTTEQTIETPVIWEAIASIMTAL